MTFVFDCNPRQIAFRHAGAIRITFVMESKSVEGVVVI